jgi:hypothetical protein
LIAESDLNRAQMAGDLDALRTGMHAFAERAKSFGAIASSAATLVAGLAGRRREAPGPDPQKSSWLKTIIKGAGLVSTLWMAFRSKSK